jgi:hypothetical protein
MDIAKQRVFSADVLVASKWKFSNDNGYLGFMEFDPNGKINNYIHDNENSWKLNQHGNLELLHKNGTVSTLFL